MSITIFIDESGIHKNIGASTIVLIYIEMSNQFALEQEIVSIEQTLKINYFHWSDFGSKRGWNIREKFIDQISCLDFKIKVGLLKNPIKLAADFDNVLNHLLIEKRIDQLIIDGQKPRWYQRRFKSNLRNRGLSVKKLKMINDEISAGLRLADALAGLIRSHHDQPTILTKKLYQKLSNKITAQLIGGQVIR